MSRITRSISVALAALAIAAPAAGAMSDRGDVRTSSLAGTSTPRQDLRNPDQRNPVPNTVPQPVGKTVVQSPAREVDGDGTSPLLYIVPGLGIAAVAGVVIVRGNGRVRRSHA
jgi:hypothetical protein